MNLLLNIIFTIVFIIGLPFMINYFILQKDFKYGLIFIFSSIYIVSFILGFFISWNVGKSNCNHTHTIICLKKAFKQSFFTTLVYAIIFFFPIFKSGFIGLLGDTTFSNSLAESIILVLSSISLSIDNYFKSITDQCKLDFNLSAVSWNKIEKKLNSRKKPSSPDKIKITT